MSEESRLYDLKEKDYPNKRGDSFRSIQVFECPTCLALTNRVIMGGSPGYGVRVICTHASECWHHDIEEEIEKLRKGIYCGYPDDFKEKVDILRAEWSYRIRNDIVGDVDFSQKRPVTNTPSIDPDAYWCEHVIPYSSEIREEFLNMTLRKIKDIYKKNREHKKRLRELTNKFRV